MIDADRKGIGGFLSGEPKAFTDKTLKINSGDTLILYTDGIIDQQNTERKRYGTNRFTAVISQNINEPMANIKASIEKAFDSYADPEEQIDDVTIIGLRFN